MCSPTRCIAVNVMPVLQTNLQVIGCPQKSLMGPNRTKLLHDLYGQTHSCVGLLHTAPQFTHTNLPWARTCMYAGYLQTWTIWNTGNTATKMFATKHCLYRISLCDWLQNAQNCLKQVRHFITTRGDVFSSVT